MRYRLRTLLIVLGLAPPVLAGAWWAWGMVRAMGPNVGRMGIHPFAIALLILLVAPLWIPLVYVTHLSRTREFTLRNLILFTLAEVASIAVCAFLFNGLP